jgi:hypothetical protein
MRRPGILDAILPGLCTAVAMLGFHDSPRLSAFVAFTAVSSIGLVVLRCMYAIMREVDKSEEAIQRLLVSHWSKESENEAQKTKPPA